MTRDLLVHLDGVPTPILETAFLAAGLLGKEPAVPDALPYVFCGNGACRDCNLLVEGLEDVPSCRVPLVAGLSVRTGEGAGDGNALSRRLRPPEPGEPIVADVAVVGAGASGTEAVASSRSAGRETLWLDARGVDLPGLRSRSPVAVVDGRLVVYELGRARPLRVRKLVLATGCRDRFPAFSGSTLPGVLPLDVLERYLELGALPARRWVLVGHAERLRNLTPRLRSGGAESVTALPDPSNLRGVHGRQRVEAVQLADGRSIEADALGVSFRREPALALAKALGCRTRWDRDARVERAEVGPTGESSVAGIFLARRKC